MLRGACVLAIRDARTAGRKVQRILSVWVRAKSNRGMFLAKFRVYGLGTPLNTQPWTLNFERKAQQ